MPPGARYVLGSSSVGVCVANLVEAAVASWRVVSQAASGPLPQAVLLSPGCLQPARQQLLMRDAWPALGSLRAARQLASRRLDVERYLLHLLEGSGGLVLGDVRGALAAIEWPLGDQGSLPLGVVVLSFGRLTLAMVLLDVVYRLHHRFAIDLRTYVL